MDIISALYPKEGGPCLGFCCRAVLHFDPDTMPQESQNRYPRECCELFRTEEGAWAHAARVHGVLRQPGLPNVILVANKRSDVVETEAKVLGPDDTLQQFRLTSELEKS